MHGVYINSKARCNVVTLYQYRSQAKVTFWVPRPPQLTVGRGYLGPKFLPDENLRINTIAVQIHQLRSQIIYFTVHGRAMHTLLARLAPGTTAENEEPFQGSIHEVVRNTTFSLLVLF